LHHASKLNKKIINKFKIWSTSPSLVESGFYPISTKIYP
jgi:hypothetical protein